MNFFRATTVAGLAFGYVIPLERPISIKSDHSSDIAKSVIFALDRQAAFMFYSFLKVAILGVISLQLAASFQLAVFLGEDWAAFMNQSFFDWV